MEANTHRKQKFAWDKALVELFTFDRLALENNYF